MIPISVCIIAKNEEENIAKCLAPLADLPLEIIIADTGSTDRTKEVAKQYGAKVYDFQWIDDFSAARNFSISKASNDYILVLDSDEFTVEIDIEEISRLIEENPDAVGMLLRDNTYESNGATTTCPDHVERLFNKNLYHYEWSIHEQLVGDDGTSCYPRYEIPLSVHHVGYSGTLEERKKKVERNNQLLFREIEKDPENPYFYFQVGQSYNMISDYENAYKYYKKAMSFDLNPFELWVKMMVNAYGNAMVNTGRLDEAIQTYNLLYDVFGDCADFHGILGVAYLNKNEPLKAMMEFVKAVNSPIAYETGANTYLAYNNMGIVNEMFGNIPEAIKFYRMCGDFPIAKEALRKLGALEESEA